MSNLPVPSDDREDLFARFREMTVEELMQLLADGLNLTARSLLSNAVAIAVLEEKGKDLSGLKISLLHHLRKIACGQLLPEVVVRFAGKPSLITRVGSLPIPEQRRLAAGEHVLLLVPDVHEGGYTHRMADPLDMSAAQISQVFARDHIRSEAEQALKLDERHEEARTPIPETVGNLKIDKERDGIMVGRHFVSRSDMETALRILRK
jgi:hypothetical protein